MMRTLALCLLIAIALFGLTACGEGDAEHTPVRFGFPLAGIGTLPNGLVGVAIANGYVEHYLNAAGYTLVVQTFLGAAPAINAALADDELDIVEYFGFPAVMSRANGLEHYLLSVTRWGSNWILVAGTESGIESIYDLRGKSVAYMAGTATHMYLLNVLSEAGLEPEDIIHIDDVSVIEGLSNVAIGRYDATVIVNGQQVAFEEEGAIRVIHQGFLADEYTFFEPMVLVARSEFYNEHPDVSVAIQKALLRARDRGRQDYAAFYRTIAENTGVDFDVIMSSTALSFDERYPLNIGEQHMSRLENTLAFLRAYGFTDGNIDFDVWHDGRTIILANEYFYND